MRGATRNIITLFVLIILVLIIINFINSMFRSKFKSGECIKDYRNGYIWQINNFSFGKYRIMGWQGTCWGNSVEVDKEILERKDINGIPVYHKVVCPEFNP